VLNRSCRVVPATELTSTGLEDLPLPGDQVLVGSPTVSGRVLAQDSSIEVGIWEHTAGTTSDIEADEVFIVLAGRATIQVEGGPTLEVGPGDVGFLMAGSATVWTVHEPLRKLYFAAVDSGS
jgi:hypothetical protein